MLDLRPRPSLSFGGMLAHAGPWEVASSVWHSKSPPSREWFWGGCKTNGSRNLCKARLISSSVRTPSPLSSIAAKIPQIDICDGAAMQAASNSHDYAAKLQEQNSGLKTIHTLNSAENFLLHQAAFQLLDVSGILQQPFLHHKFCVIVSGFKSFSKKHGGDNSDHLSSPFFGWEPLQHLEVRPATYSTWIDFLDDKES